MFISLDVDISSDENCFPPSAPDPRYNISLYQDDLGPSDRDPTNRTRNSRCPYLPHFIIFVHTITFINEFTDGTISGRKQ
jgi:hypothetical protein